jgi:prenyltransferase beta subunit
MLQVARLAPKSLGDSSQLVARFLRASLNADGGFRDRAGASDLYYTVFGLEGLLALSESLPESVQAYVDGFGDGAHLDFVHLTCLARASASTGGISPARKEGLAARIQTFRSADGGFNVVPNASAGSAYACFLAMGALEDLGSPIVDAPAMLVCLDNVRAVDGGYANHPEASEGSTPATAAAVMVMRHLDAAPDTRAAEWLLARSHAGGGFLAAPRAPLPDLLSTATALHALAAVHVDIDPLKEQCLDFIDSLWTSTGGFYGSWADDVLDCEYTYYGLLALGHLSL